MDHPGGRSDNRGGLPLSTDFCIQLSFHQWSILIHRECFSCHVLGHSTCQCPWTQHLSQKHYHIQSFHALGIWSPFLPCSLTLFHQRLLKCQPSASVNALQLLKMCLGLQYYSALNINKFSLKVVCKFLQIKWLSLNFLRWH